MSSFFDFKKLTTTPYHSIKLNIYIMKLTLTKKTMLLTYQKVFLND